MRVRWQWTTTWYIKHDARQGAYKDRAPRARKVYLGTFKAVEKSVKKAALKIGALDTVSYPSQLSATDRKIPMGPALTR